MANLRSNKPSWPATGVAALLFFVLPGVSAAGDFGVWEANGHILVGSKKRIENTPSNLLTGWGLDPIKVGKRATLRDIGGGTFRTYDEALARYNKMLDTKSIWYPPLVGGTHRRAKVGGKDYDITNALKFQYVPLQPWETGTPPTGRRRVPSPPEGSSGFWRWLFPSKERIRDGWETWKDPEQPWWEQGCGLASVVGAFFEVLLTLIGAVALGKMMFTAAKAGVARLSARAAAQLAEKEAVPALESAEQAALKKLAEKYPNVLQAFGEEGLKNCANLKPPANDLVRMLNQGKTGGYANKLIRQFLGQMQNKSADTLRLALSELTGTELTAQGETALNDVVGTFYNPAKFQ